MVNTASYFMICEQVSFSFLTKNPPKTVPPAPPGTTTMPEKLNTQIRKISRSKYWNNS